MLSFNLHPFGDTLRARVYTLSRAWRCYSSPEGSGHSGSSRLALRDSGCTLELVQSPDLGLK